MIRRFAFRQTLVGSYRELDSTVDRSLVLTLSAERARLLPPMSGRLAVVGEIDARDLADHRALRGSVDAPRWQLGATRYELEFSANDGRRLRLSAAREPRLREPVWSLTRVLGAILDEAGQRCWDVELRLDYREAVGRWLGS